MSPAAPASVQHRRGPLTALMARTDRLPGAGWWVFVAFGVGLIAWGQVVEWAAGRMPVGTFDQNLAVTIPYGPYALLMLVLGRRISRRALETFWPATGWPDDERSSWLDQFLVVGLLPESMALLVGAVGGIAALASTPALILGPEPDRLSVYVAYLPSFLAGYAISAAAALVAVRWLVLVARIHRQATAIDVFDREPIYAFSRLTVLAGISYLGAAYYSLTVNAAVQVGNATSIVFIGLTMIFAVAAFVVPMWGIHDRLASEKEALLRDVERRTNVLAAELYARIDAGQFDSTDAVNTSLSGLAAQRDRIERLPTWPWRPELLRGFVSALILPLAVFILTRFISDLL